MGRRGSSAQALDDPSGASPDMCRTRDVETASAGADANSEAGPQGERHGRRESSAGLRFLNNLLGNIRSTGQFVLRSHKLTLPRLPPNRCRATVWPPLDAREPRVGNITSEQSQRFPGNRARLDRGWGGVRAEERRVGKE